MVPEGSTARESLYADIITASPGLFSALRIPLKRGRLFTDADSRTGAPVLILSETAVKRFWPDGTDPLGLSVTMREWGDPYAARVIGIVGDVRQSGPETDPAPAAYYPVAQFPETLLRHSIVIRTDGDPLSVVRCGARTWSGAWIASSRWRRFERSISFWPRPSRNADSI